MLRRSCWCQKSSITCPIHALGADLASCGHGDALFPGITAPKALSTLRSVLAALGIEQAADYKPQDFRGGHADDLRASGAPLRTILEAGGWRSPAFMKYLNLDQLESGMVVQAHLDEGSHDDVQI